MPLFTLFQEVRPLLEYQYAANSCPVKQVIGQAEVLPWSRYLKQDDCIRRTERTRENDFHYRSPQGGLIAHWLFTVLMIAISASIKSTLESVGLPGYIQTYTHCFVLSRWTTFFPTYM